MSWSLHWWLFFVAIIPCTIMVLFSRWAMTPVNVARYGPRGDLRTEPGAAIAGSILAGGVYAAIITAVAGFLF
jgi:hypothetical protein